jgi:hypothetical protein
MSCGVATPHRVAAYSKWVSELSQFSKSAARSVLLEDVAAPNETFYQIFSDCAEPFDGLLLSRDRPAVRLFRFRL